MHKTVSVLAVSLVSLGLIAGASAQTKPSGETSTTPMRQAWAVPSNAVEARQVIGMRVKNDQGKDVGEIDQLIVDRADGKITHVVLGRGGVLGVGEQKVVVPWSDVKIQPDANNRNRWLAMVDQARIDSAPRYERREGTPAASPSTTPTTRPSTSPSTSPGTR